jgi:pyochelin biosynthetic protein PchC
VLVAVSSFPAPQRLAGGELHLASDEALATGIQRLGGDVAAALAHPELRALVLPVLRGDVRLAETYRPDVEPRLSSPILACVGASDPVVGIDEVQAWEHVTGGSFELRVFPGGHFYLTEARARVIAGVVRSAGGRSSPRLRTLP